MSQHLLANTARSNVNTYYNARMEKEYYDKWTYVGGASY